MDHLDDEIRRIKLPVEDLALISPNTRTAPLYRTTVDAELTRKIYSLVPVLINEVSGHSPWKLVLRQGFFNMTSDSSLFFTSPGVNRLPLYEGKMVQAFDHRAASVVVNPRNLRRPGAT